MVDESSSSADDVEQGATKTFDLHLDGDESFPRRLLKLGHHLVAYGGDDGTITALDVSSSPTTESDFFRIRVYDDAIRAVAVSDDGKRVVVGFEDGSTKIYVYEDYDIKASKNAAHPFVLPAQSSSGGDSADKDLFLSQSDSVADGLLTNRPGETEWAGPFGVDGPLRDLAFLPHSHRLVVASEAPSCNLFIVNLATEQGIRDEQSPRPLQELAEKAHNESGVRSVAVVVMQQTNNGGDNSSKVILSSLGMDGRLCLWDISQKDDPSQWKLLKKESRPCVTKKDIGENLGADAFDRACRPHWLRNVSSPYRSLLTLPGETYLQFRSIVPEKDTLEVEECDQPNESSTGDDSPIKGHVETVVCTTSLTGAMNMEDPYFITAGRDGRVVVWELSEREDGSLKSSFVREIGRYERNPPTDLLWERDPSTGEETLFITCDDASMVMVAGRSSIAPTFVQKSTVVASSNSLSDDSKTKKNGTAKVDSDKIGTQKNTSVKVGKTILKGKTDKSGDDDDSMFDEDDAPLPKSRFIDDEADDEDSEDGAPSSESKHDIKKDRAKSKVVAKKSRGDDDVNNDQDDDGESVHDEDYEDDGSETSRVKINSYDYGYQSAIKLPEPQAAFAPSSTPLDLTRRFMCWNHIGSVTHLDVENGRNAIDLHFTDSAFRRPISFTDNMGFILGSLGEDGAIFATDLADDDDLNDDDLLGTGLLDGLAMSEATKAAVKRSHRNRMKKLEGQKSTGSTLYFNRFETFGNIREKDWYITLGDGERALGCATGEGWAAAVTSRRLLRLFTTGGNQGHIIWLEGDPVTIIGRSRFLAVFYHVASPLADGTQKLGCLLYDAMANRIITKGSATCISTGASLSWAGFSNEGSLLAMDSDGMLSMFACSNISSEDLPTSWEWTPMLDTIALKKSADDSFWPITVYDGKLVCVPLKGGTKHPDASRRPVTTLLGFRMPMARSTLSKISALEELSVRADIALNQKKAVHILTSGGLDDEDFEKEFLALSAQLDKVTLKMFATIVETGKLERALDLVERLHLEKSFDIAMAIADSQRKLVDLIEEAKYRKFVVPGEDTICDEPVEFNSRDNRGLSSQRITPDLSSKPKRSFDEISGVSRMAAPRQPKRNTVFG